jgi:hypothetical protein
MVAGAFAALRAQLTIPLKGDVPRSHPSEVFGPEIAVDIERPAVERAVVAVMAVVGFEIGRDKC